MSEATACALKEVIDKFLETNPVRETVELVIRNNKVTCILERPSPELLSYKQIKKLEEEDNE